MRWFHSADREWLAERKKYVTASDVQRLLPTTPTGRPRTNLDEAYRRVWAEKQCEVTEEDMMSSGMAARGHILERYAVAMFNKLSGAPYTLYHWDDIVVTQSDGVSCSPDALSEPQPTGIGVAVEGRALNATVMGEIKCYGAAAHYETGLADPMTLEERWQIATAFHTMPMLRTGVLILFNPGARHPMFKHLYDRTMLATELDLIKTVSGNYWVEAKKIEAQACVHCDTKMKVSCITEEEIIAELLAEEEMRNSSMNP